MRERAPDFLHHPLRALRAPRDLRLTAIHTNELYRLSKKPALVWAPPSAQCRERAGRPSVG